MLKPKATGCMCMGYTASATQGCSLSSTGPQLAQQLHLPSLGRCLVQAVRVDAVRVLAHV